jgi:uncharacterized protein YqeY
VSLSDTLKEDMKTALKAGERLRLGALRLALAAIKQKEVDERTTLNDAEVIGVLEKLIKQGRDSEQQFAAAARREQAEKEAAEVAVLEAYLPERLTDDEVDALVAEVVAATGASSMKDMGKVMAEIRSRAAGRVDMAAVNPRVRAALGQG